MFGILSKFKLYQLYVAWCEMYKNSYWRAWGGSDSKNYAKVGKHCQIGKNQTLNPKLISMESWSRLQNLNNMIARSGKLIIKKYAAVSSQCIIIPENHTPTVGIPQFLSILHINDQIRTIVVNEDAWVGAGCILMSKSEIGRGAVIGAGSIVTKRIPPYAVAVGSPAKIVATRFTIEQILKHEAILYPPEERMSREELEELFETNYKGKEAIGTSEISDIDREKLKEAKKKYDIKDYSQFF